MVKRDYSKSCLSQPVSPASFISIVFNLSISPSLSGGEEFHGKAFENAGGSVQSEGEMTFQF